MNKPSKKIITSILISALFFIAIPILSAQTPTARVQYRCPATNTQEYTPAIQVDFKIVNDPASTVDMDLSLVKVTYCYSYEGLTDQAANVTYATGNTSDVIVTLVPGSAEITFASGAGIVLAGGEYEVSFEITKLNGENFIQKGDFSWDATYLNYTNFTRMALFYNDIKVTGALCTAPTPEPSDPFIPPQPIIQSLSPCGDVNLDSNVNIIDALLLAQEYVGLNPVALKAPSERCDVDCNGLINILDALRIAQFYVGLTTELKCCKTEGVRIEIENYNNASDNSAPNEGLRYRTVYAKDFGVDLEDSWLGSFNSGWVTAGEWLEYDINLTQSGSYEVWIAVAHDDAADLVGRVAINYDIIGEITVPNTDPYNVDHPPGHWQNWINYKVGSAQLYSGINRIRIEHLGATGGFNVDFIWLGLQAGEPPSLGEIAPVQPPAEYVSSVAENGQLQVIGNNLCNSAGNPVQLKGFTSHSELRWIWICKDFTITRLAYEYGIDMFRVSITPTASNYGYMAAGHKEVLKERLIAYIDDTIDAGIYGVIDWHVKSAIDLDADTIAEALLFFDEMSERYAAYPNVIYEICADPPETFAWADLKAYAEQVIPVIRNNAPDSIIIMGTPTNNKNVDIASVDPITGYTNILYSLGFAAGQDSQELRDVADIAIANGLPLIVPSWKTSNAADNAYDFEESEVWVNWMAANNISWINFAVSNKDELPSIFKVHIGFTGGTGEDANGYSGGFMGPWVQDDLTEGGQWIVNKF